MADAGFAEAYVMRKLHKEKTKKMDTRTKLTSSQDKADGRNLEGRSSGGAASAARGGGCFSLSMFRKIHPTAAPSSES